MRKLYVPLLAAVGLVTLHAADARSSAHDIFKELIDINTTESSGNVTEAARAVEKRLKAAGYSEADIHLVGPNARKQNLVVRLRGTGKQKPILFLAHLDVVEAKRSDWSVDPFKFIEKDGYFYGRGTSDDKQGAAILAANFIRLKEEGFKPDRDFILALTADEEGGPDNGVDWLLKNRRELIDAEYCMNTDAGGGQIKNGKRLLLGVEASEKLFSTYKLEVKNSGGHSSMPVPENAIYRLAEALVKLSKYQFPVALNEVTRAFFERESHIEKGDVAAEMTAVLKNPPDPAAVKQLSKSAYYNAQLRTTCVATMLQAGHAENALPQTATATVNCRLLPGETTDHVLKTIVNVVADPKISVVHASERFSSPASPLRPDVFKAIERIADGIWPQIPVVPVMDTGASDGRQLREAGIPTYGLDATFTDIDDVRAHGKDERMGVQSFYEGVEFYYRFMKALGGNSGK
jgi:acetylornithine deacetylase/succinyl-diaminopimelate desuccinylase-like protein